MNDVSLSLIEKFRDQTENSAFDRAMMNALTKHNVKDVAFTNRGLEEAQFAFSVNVPTMEVTNQKQSGRCWIFAALNLFREEIAEKCNIEKFELSQNYIAFWDKFEKINFFYESMIELADRPLTDRLVIYLLDSGIGDGGQWNMLVNLVEKYGLVPKAAMQETFQSSHTRDMNRLINTLLRKGALDLRKAYSEGSDVMQVKEKYLLDAYRLLTMCFGVPPKSFDFEYTDKDDAYHIDRGLTPIEFAGKYTSLNLRSDYVGIINSPTEDKPFYQQITIDYLGNVAGAPPVTYLNLPMEEIKDLIVRQLKDGKPVWFGSDVGSMGERSMGIWSDKIYDFDGTLGIDFSMTKEERLNIRESAMNHAMVITGVNLDENGVPNRWKIENSWSDQNGEKGYYVMNAGWFDKFVYQAVIEKSYLNEKQLEALQTEPMHFMPWDPMGTLA